jgi:hypothetical protein
MGHRVVCDVRKLKVIIVELQLLNYRSTDVWILVQNVWILVQNVWILVQNVWILVQNVWILVQTFKAALR